VLFAAAAGFVFWRQTQIGVLVDIAYILNTASRIAGGDVPYSDFRLAHPPLTFAMQALLIRVFGPFYLVQMLYTSIASGAAAVLAYQIARRLLRDVVARPNVLAAILCAPLVPLGIYAIFPHPHYDPDSALWVLAGLFAVFVAREHPTPRRWILAGALLVVPLFIKQNIGGAFLPAVLAALAVDAFAHRSRIREFAWCLCGVAAALAVAIGSLQLIAGVNNYLTWTITYAMGERGIRLDRFIPFTNSSAILVGLLIPVTAAASRYLPRLARIPVFVALVLVPLTLIAVTVLPPLFWVPLLFGACAAALYASLQGRLDFETLLPFVAAGTVAGTFQANGLFDSSFGTFPLLVVTLASLMRLMQRWLEPSSARLTPIFGSLTALLLFISGTLYTLGNQRLGFIDLAPNSPIVRSTYPTLFGLSARGRYIVELDETLSWIRHHVGPSEPLTMLPGEDPVYYALGLHPGLPAVQFIDGSNAYSPEELLRIAEKTGLRWVFVKELRQLRSPDDLPQGPVIVELLTRDADLVAQFGPYSVYRRR
jgi:4-amino-4-deoxy-L-arabinose transferase-like glycosyltransferase